MNMRVPHPLAGAIQQSRRRVNPADLIDRRAIDRQVQSRTDANFEHPASRGSDGLPPIAREPGVAHCQISWERSASCKCPSARRLNDGARQGDRDLRRWEPDLVRAAAVPGYHGGARPAHGWPRRLKPASAHARRARHDPRSACGPAPTVPSSRADAGTGGALGTGYAPTTA